jgi:glycine/serine hydroxymethyltransferase
MWNDPIIEELHQLREAHAAKFNNDLKAIFDDFKRAEEEYRQKGYKVVSWPLDNHEESEVTTTDQ